ncbi:MAG: glycoside hydrolase family 172 protein [Planctomycetota bacterium]
MIARSARWLGPRCCWLLLVELSLGQSAVAPAARSAEEPITLVSLLERMCDRNVLYRPAPPRERCVQFSSYDRSCIRDAKVPEAWYANDDRGHYLRVDERDGQKEHVLVDCAGPGYLARLWSANPSGMLHFDVDGERVWSIDFGALCRGEIEGVPAPLAAMCARGGNVYLPIPFAKQLTVSATDGSLYYLCDVVELPSERKVVPFSAQSLAAAGVRGAVATACKEMQRTVATPARDSASGRAGLGRIGQSVTIPNDRCVQRMRIALPQLAAGSGGMWQHLENVVLVVRCGDEETLRLPLRSFAGAGPDWAPVANRCLSVREGMIDSWFAMPMPDGGSITLEGAAELGERAPSFLQVEHEVLDIAEPLLFRASYHIVRDQPTRPFSDHVVLDAKGGSGRFVGCSLLVRNPTRIWWGEGDEKIWVDGESFPSWFGTGTEDYFGYAWCDPTPFQAPHHGQVSCEGPMNYGFTQLHRLHLLDSIPFQRSLRFEFERWHWVKDTTIDYETVAYWYGAAGAASGLPALPPLAERRLARLPQPEMFVAKDAIEGELLPVLRCTGGRNEVQNLAFFDGDFSRDAHRWWRDGKPGDELVLELPVAKAGRYRLTVAMTKANDFGIVQLYRGDQKLGEPFDGYTKDVSPSGPLVVGEFEFEPGDALRLVLVGRNPKAKPNHMVGLDYLRLEAVQ